MEKSAPWSTEEDKHETTFFGLGGLSACAQR